MIRDYGLKAGVFTQSAIAMHASFDLKVAFAVCNCSNVWAWSFVIWTQATPPDTASQSLLLAASHLICKALQQKLFCILVFIPQFLKTLQHRLERPRFADTALVLICCISTNLSADKTMATRDTAEDLHCCPKYRLPISKLDDCLHKHCSKQVKEVALH